MVLMTAQSETRNAKGLPAWTDPVIALQAHHWDLWGTSTARKRSAGGAATSRSHREYFSIKAAANPVEGAQKAVETVRGGECDILMKGKLNTAELLRAVLHREVGLRGESLLSHIAVIELGDGRLTTLTDGAMNIRPDLEQKAAIVDNAIRFAWSIGLTTPKVALLAAIETVNPKMPDTVDAAVISQMAARGQFSREAIVDGPLAFDNAFSKAAAAQKGITSPVAGEVDILWYRKSLPATFCIKLSAMPRVKLQV